MGTVFEAIDVKMDRKVALKVLSFSLTDSERAGARFAREAWIAGKLSHPNLVKVFERGEVEGSAFFSMELIDGGSLFDVIQNLKIQGRDATWGLEFGSREYITWAITQVAAAARGLDYAHRQGVVHRDVKPMNILLSRDPRGVKVADFGLAVDAEATRLTRDGAVMGTIAYMAPEQVQGRQDLIAAWTDVYALGVTLFELLTLDLPYSGKTQQLYMNAVLTAEAKRPRKLNERVSRDLETVLGKALEKDPKDRYPTAAAFADDLENVLFFRPIRARPQGAGKRILKFAQRKPMHATLTVVLLVAVPGVSVLSYRAVQHQRLLEQLQTEKQKEQVRRLNQDERFAQALPLLDQILQRHPEDVDTLRARSITLFRLAQTEKADAARTHLREAALADASSLVRMLPRVSWPYRLRAFLLSGFGHAVEAQQDEQTAAQYRAKPASIQELEIDATLAQSAGKNQEAIGILSEIITRQNDANLARLSRALLYERSGDLDKAMTDYEVVAALMPSDPVSRVNLGRLLTLKGDLEGGAERLRQALKIDPSYAVGYEGLSDNLARCGKKKADSGDKEEARKDFLEAESAARKALELDDSLSFARINLGAALMERNRLLIVSDRNLISQAAEEFQKVIEAGAAGAGSSQGVDQAYGNLCDALIQLGDLPRALRTCQEIAQRQPDNSTNHYNLAGVYALSNRPEDALRSLEQDVALGDHDDAYLAADKWFLSLHGNPRFESLLQKMKE